MQEGLQKISCTRFKTKFTMKIPIILTNIPGHAVKFLITSQVDTKSTFGKLTNFNLTNYTAEVFNRSKFSG